MLKQLIAFFSFDSIDIDADENNQNFPLPYMNNWRKKELCCQINPILQKRKTSLQKSADRRKFKQNNLSIFLHVEFKKTIHHFISV